MKRGFVFVAVFLVIASFVFAAGGGGGGGGGSSSGGGGGSSPVFTKPVCDTKGSITFTKSPSDEVEITATKAGESSFVVPGEWEGDTFNSEEAIFMDAGSYSLQVDDDTETFSCPGFVFSCKLVDLKIKECTKEENKVEARFSYSEDLSRLKFQFTNAVDGRALTYQNAGVISTGLENLQISGSDNEYTVVVENALSLINLQISDMECTGRYYAYSKMNCVEKGKEMQEVPGKDLKCSGYLDVADRVKCRLDLREKEEYERENFFPEECKAREDAQQCLEVYQAVQECWDFPNNQARTNCVKRVLKLGDIFLEKANCNALDAGKRENCNQELRDKVYALVKFRLYNLEEEAEKLMELGKLTEGQVVDFVVKMENYKLQFNQAQSKEERKQVLLGARKDWVALIKSFWEGA